MIRIFIIHIKKAGNLTNEKLWRLPLDTEYDIEINSNRADIKNIGSTRYGGSIHAAQFIKRFIEGNIPWAHLDIAGVASIPGETDFSGGGATGWGVRTINSLISKYYEK